MGIFGLIMTKEEIKKKWGRTVKGLLSTIYSMQKVRSETRGHPLPSYTKTEFDVWFLKQPNFYRIYRNWVYSRYDKDLKPSVDRIDNSKPYTLNNIQLMTWGENNNKSVIDFCVSTRKSNTSGVTGVLFHLRSGKWAAVLTVKKKRMHLGLFEYKEDAIRARKEAERKFLGLNGKTKTD
jgi:hypothetical protein